MFATAIIIFREVLEVAVILSVVLTATRGIPDRNHFVWMGLGLGILGSGIVAFFTKSIANAASGMGQEYFNAAILWIAVFMIGWTVVWMQKHGRELTQKIKEVGKNIALGQTPLYAITVIVALSLWREGSEMVLFTYGIFSSGQATAFQVFSGAALGLVAGILVGLLIYYGLLKISQRKLFMVTSWLLMFLAAGMAAQATSFLIAADLLPALMQPIWDTGHLLSEQSVVGKILHSLVGYSESPSLMQLIAYLLTLGLIALLYLRIAKLSRKR